MLNYGDWGLGPIPNPQSPIPKTEKFAYVIFSKINKFN